MEPENKNESPSSKTVGFIFTASLIASLLVSQALPRQEQINPSRKLSQGIQLATVSAADSETAGTALFAKLDQNSNDSETPEPQNFPALFFTISPFSNPPELHSQVALVRELDSPHALLAHNSKSRWPIASITKLMTAVVILENMDENESVPITYAAVETEGIAGNLIPGEAYSVKDLTKAMLAVSSNDATKALQNEFDARFGTNLLVNIMNEKARDLDMLETTFEDPIGFSVINQSTANDLLKLVRYIYTQHPRIFEVTSSPSVHIYDRVAGKSRELLNINYLSSRDDYLGGKTGYTDEAGNNLLSLFLYKNRPILIIVLGAEDRFLETEDLYAWLVAQT